MRKSWDDTRRVSPLFVGLIRFSLFTTGATLSLSLSTYLRSPNKTKERKKKPLDGKS